jgi:uncharacterized protein Yka (UPF0111/DUF47 family)
MKGKGWLLPDTPDVAGMLERQVAVTVEGIDALDAWAGGDPAAADRVRECEHSADDEKRVLRRALTEAFSTPIEPEDLFELSREVDEVLNGAKNLVREAEVMEIRPDGPMAEMAHELAAGTRHLAAAVASMNGGRTSEATEASDAATKSQRHVEHIYRAAMSALIGSDDVAQLTARRELYRRLVRISDHLAGVAERVWYSVLREG